jgi:hypothetical protein
LGSDETHEAMRDLVRARVDAHMQLTRARQQLLAFRLRHGRTFAGTARRGLRLQLLPLSRTATLLTGLQTRISRTTKLAKNAEIV